MMLDRSSGGSSFRVHAGSKIAGLKKPTAVGTRTREETRTESGKFDSHSSMVRRKLASSASVGTGVESRLNRRSFAIPKTIRASAKKTAEAHKAISPDAHHAGSVRSAAVGLTEVPMRESGTKGRSAMKSRATNQTVNFARGLCFP